MPRVTITVPGQTAQPYRFQLDRKVVSLGRGSENDIVIESGSVSGKHAEMRRVECGYILTDVGSTNGIKEGGLRQQQVSLVSGMTVNLGDVAFDFSLSEEELQILGSEQPAFEPVVAQRPMAELSEQYVDDLPRSKREPARSSRHQVEDLEEADAGAGFGMIILFIVLAAGAFYAGISIRHQKETGESLLKAIVNKEEVSKEAPTEQQPIQEEADPTE